MMTMLKYNDKMYNISMRNLIYVTCRDKKLLAEFSNNLQLEFKTYRKNCDPKVFVNFLLFVNENYDVIDKDEFYDLFIAHLNLETGGTK